MLSAKAEAAEKRGSCKPKDEKKRGHEGRRIGPKPRLRCCMSRIGLTLTTSEHTRAVGSAEAEAAEQLGPYRPKADKQRSHDGRRIRPKPNATFSWGRIGRRLTSTEATMAVESGRSRMMRLAGAV